MKQFWRRDELRNRVVALEAENLAIKSENKVLKEESQALSANVRDLYRATRQNEDTLRDMLDLLMHRAEVPKLELRFNATKALAESSPDHYAPRGTANDNTRHPRFVRRCEQLYREIRHLDIGCAGGGLVWDFAVRGHISAGVEGSDYSLKNCRGEWRTIPDRLFTADITEPFEFTDVEDRAVLFNIVTAWELFEHIPADLVDQTIKNIKDNLASDGTLVCSIATFVDRDDAAGIVYHPTVQPREWWVERFARMGLAPVESLFEVKDFVRGSGNPRAWDWDVTREPQLGFHLALRPI